MHKKISILVVEYQWERTALRTLLIMLAFLTLGYLYFVAASVLNVIAHKEADARSMRTESSIGQLEQKYFTLSQNLTLAEGSALGLSTITNQSYAYRHGNVGQAPTTKSEI